MARVSLSQMHVRKHKHILNINIGKPILYTYKRTVVGVVFYKRTQIGTEIMLERVPCIGALQTKKKGAHRYSLDVQTILANG